MTDTQLPIGPAPELNPYRPDIPDSIRTLSPDLYSYLQEMQGTLRSQHNATQAGDTTFSWQVLLTLNEAPVYTPGSTGRFSHPDYGMLRGRYVQFDSMDPTIWTGNPVGLVSSESNLWLVTNDVNKSSQSMAIGLGASYVTPEKGEYGWVIIDGINIQSLYYKGDTAPKQYDSFSWGTDNLLHSVDAVTRVVGELISSTPIQLKAGETDIWELPPGSVLCDFDSKTGSFTSLQAQLDDLEARTAIYSQIDYGTQIEEIRRQVSLKDGLNELTLTMLTQRVTTLTKDKSSIELTQLLNATANFANQTSIWKNQADSAAGKTFTYLQATNSLVQQASAYRDEAGYHAESATIQANTAALQAGDALVSAQAASVSESNASISETNAGVFSQAAQQAAVSAQSILGSLSPPDFTQKGLYWTNTEVGDPATVASVADSWFSLVSGEGWVFTNEAQSTFGFAEIDSKEVQTPIPGHIYEVETAVRILTANTSGGTDSEFQVQLIGLDSAYGTPVGEGSPPSGYLQVLNNPPVGSTYTVLKTRYTVPATGAPIFLRSRVYGNFKKLGSTDGNQKFRIKYIAFRDVTESAIAAQNADAAAASSITAGTAATNAGVSATAAEASNTAAATSYAGAQVSEGNALTYKNQASTSEANALASKNTATTQAGLASTSAYNANISAGLASGSAGTAATQAGLSYNSAQASAGSATTATTQATNAGNSAIASHNSELAAGGSATTASTQAGLATTYAGQAYTYSQQALGYSVTATGAAGTATSQAGIATTAAGTATTQADAAGGSAGQAAGYAGQANSYMGQAYGYSVAASGSAQTATTQAGTATTQAGIATGAASSASAYVGQAAGYAGQASGFAGSASGYASQASSYVSLAAQFSMGSLVKNPTFQDPSWSGAVDSTTPNCPPGWTLWATYGSAYLGKGGGSSPYGPNRLRIDRNTDNNGNYGVYQDITLTNNNQACKVLVNVDIQLYSGDIISSGILLQGLNSSGTAIYGDTLGLASAPRVDGSQGNTGTAGRYQWSKSFSIPAGIATLRVYIMSGWQGFQNPVTSGAIIDWDKVTVDIQSAGESAGLGAKSYTDAQISQVNSAYTYADSALAGQINTVAAQSKGAANWLSNTGFEADTNFWAPGSNNPGVDNYGINPAGDNWHPLGENVIGLHYTGAGESYVYSFAPIPPDYQNTYIEASAYFASHRAQYCYVAMDFFAADRSTIVGSRIASAYVRPGTGGQDPAGFTRIIAKGVIPNGAKYVQTYYVRGSTDGGQSEGWLWVWRPLVGPTTQTAGPLDYVNSRVSAQLLNSVNSTVGNLGVTVTQQQTAINGIYGVYKVNIDGNGRFAGFSLIGGGGDVSVFNVTADRFYINDQNIFRVENGVTYIQSAVIGTATVGGRQLTAQALGFNQVIGCSDAYGQGGNFQERGRGYINLTGPADVFITLEWGQGYNGQAAWIAGIFFDENEQIRRNGGTGYQTCNSFSCALENVGPGQHSISCGWTGSGSNITFSSGLMFVSVQYRTGQ